MLKKLFRRKKRYSGPSTVEIELSHTRVQLGQLKHHLNLQRKAEIFENIHLSEFKVFSQWGDDGIIQFIVDVLQLEPKTFIEFGVENYKEANTRFLPINNNWKGLVFDGSEQHVHTIKNDPIYWQHDLTAQAAFITKENINDLIRDAGFSGELGLLHIDIDGNDYWVWKEINQVNPIVVIMEYNSVFGPSNEWTVPYSPNFFRTDAHHSNIYCGASLKSLVSLGKEKGYTFIGSNSHGNNAYFIRNDKLGPLKPLTAEEGYVNSKFREERDANGGMVYPKNEDRLRPILGMPIVNTATGALEQIKLHE